MVIKMAISSLKTEDMGRLHFSLITVKVMVRCPGVNEPSRILLSKSYIQKKIDVRCGLPPPTPTHRFIRLVCSMLLLLLRGSGAGPGVIVSPKAGYEMIISLLNSLHSPPSKMSQILIMPLIPR